MNMVEPGVFTVDLGVNTVERPLKKRAYIKNLQKAVSDDEHSEERGDITCVCTFLDLTSWGYKTRG